jgi:PPE-repeat protein
MVLDFAAMPPEINSALMYSGAGSGPLMASAAAWNNLAAELSTTASSWESIVSSLTTEQWTGAGSAAAAAAAQPYIGWLITTAAAAEQAASQISASAAAYETAFAATVPPPVIAANRSLLATLVATNFLGINTAAIAATEAQYAEMWVQDAVTMYTYAGAAAANSVLPELTPALPTTNPGAAGLQGASVAAAAANATSSNATSGLGSAVSSLLSFASVGQFGSGIWGAFQTAFPGAASIISSADGLFGSPFIFNFVQQVGVTAAWFVGNTIPTAVSYIHTVAVAGAAAPAAAAASDVAGAAAGAEAALAGSAMPTGLGGALTAGMGEASMVGGLAVPASWSSAAPATLASSTAPLEGSGWTAATEEAGSGPVTGMMPGMAAAGKGAGALAGPRYGVKPIVMPKQVVV